MIKSNMETFWAKVEPRARELGAQDSDVAVIRQKVKNLLISAEWCTSNGDVSFLSKGDEANAISAATTLVDDEAVHVVAKRHRGNRELRIGCTPTANGVATLMSASTFSPVGQAPVAPLPERVTLDTRCPRCSSAMGTIGLANDGAAIYCSKDRIVLPLV